MIQAGYITEVSTTTAGSALLGDHLVGATTLFVEDASDFNDEGGDITLGGLQYAYLSVDFDLDTLLLQDPLTQAQVDGDGVQVYPLVIEKIASVQLENDDDAIEVRIPHSLTDLIAEGVRDDVTQEAVEVELVNFDWVIRDVMGKAPVIDGTYLADSTVTLASLGDDVVFSGSGINIYAQSTDPISSGAQDGDFWLDTNVLGDGTTNILKNRVSGAWVVVQNPDVQQAIDDALAASNLADSKTRLWYQASAPTGLTSADIGDLWFDTDDNNHPYKYNGNANPGLAWDDMRDGAIVQASTDANAAKAAALPDGKAPSTSPLPTVKGTVGALLVSWTPVINHDPVTYDVHISTTQAFILSQSTLSVSTTGATATIKTLPSGTALAYGTTYYVKIVARDVDGAAASSLAASGQMVKATSGDIASDYVYAGRISVDRLDGGTLVSDLSLASTIKTAETGARVEMGSAGIKVVQSDNTPTTILGSDGNSTFKGDVEASGLTIKGGAAFRSVNNEISQGAMLRLSQKTTASAQAPTVVIDYPTVTLRDAGGLILAHPENLSGFLRTSSGKWLSCDLTLPQYYIWNVDGTLFSTTTTAQIFKGVVEIATKFYGLYYDGTTPRLARLAVDTVFTDSFTALTNWTSAGTTAVVSSQAQITAAAGGTSTLSKATSGLFDGAVSAKVIPAVGRPVTSETYMQIINGATPAITLAEVRVAGPQITFRYGNDFTTIVYDSAQHVYWRIRDMSTSVVFETSLAGTTWTVQKTVAGGTITTGATWVLGVTNPGPSTNVAPNSGLESWTTVTDDYKTYSTPTGWYRPTYPQTDTVNNPSAAGTTKVVNFGDDYYQETVKQETGTAAVAFNWNNYLFGYSGVANQVRMQTAEGTSAVPVSASTSYTFSYRMATEDFFNFQLWPHTNIDWYDANGVLISSSNNVGYPGTNTGSWAYTGSMVWDTITSTYTSPAGAAFARLRVEIDALLTSPPKQVYVDTINFYSNVGTPPPASTSSLFDDALQIRTMDGVSVAGDIPAGVNPVISTDATNIAIGWQNSGGSYTVKTFSTTSLTNIGSATTTTSPPVTGISGLIRGTFDLGTDSWVAASSAPGGEVDAFPAATNVINANQTFLQAQVAMKGIAWDGTNFWTLGANGKLYQYGTYTWTTETSSWTAGFTWVNGSQESTISPLNSFTMKKRARLTVTSAALPSSPTAFDPTNIRVYVSRDGVQHLQGTTVSGSNSLVMTTINFAGAAAPGTNSFLSGTDASIRTQNDNLIIKADGSILGATITSTGLLTAGSITSTGAISGGTVSSTGLITASAGLTVTGTTTLNGTLAGTAVTNLVSGLTSVTTADATATTTTYISAGVPQVNVTAGKTYYFRAHGTYQSSLATVGIGIRMNGTSTATYIRGVSTVWGAATSASTPFKTTITALTTANARTTTFAAATNYQWEIEGTFVVLAAGTFRVEFNASAAGSVILSRGATLVLTEM